MKNPTKDNILKAHDEGCDDVKKVIENLWPDEFERSDEGKVYAFRGNSGDIYMLNNINNKYHWQSMDTYDMVYSSHDSLNEAIEGTGYDTKSFDNQKDFFKWALKQVS